MNKKAMSIQSIFRRMEIDGIRRITISYDDSIVGKCVLDLSNGIFTRMIAIGNNPKLIKVEKLDEQKAFRILQAIEEGAYKLKKINYFKFTRSEKKHKEVV